MKVLLDTHVLLWWLSEPELLNSKATRILEGEENEVLLSAISVCEIAIKSSLGKLRLPEPAATWIGRVCEEQSLVPLALRQDHALALATLEPIHGDPFDRLLIAQSITEGVPLLTGDSIFRSYEVSVIWASRRRR